MTVSSILDKPMGSCLQLIWWLHSADGENPWSQRQTLGHDCSQRCECHIGPCSPSLWFLEFALKWQNVLDSSTCCLSLVYQRFCGCFYGVALANPVKALTGRMVFMAWCAEASRWEVEISEDDWATRLLIRWNGCVKGILFHLRSCGYNKNNGPQRNACFEG